MYNYSAYVLCTMILNFVISLFYNEIYMWH